MALQLTQPGPLSKSGNLSKNWKSFKTALHHFMVATEYGGKSDEVKISLFMSCVGIDDWQKTVDGFVYAEGEDKASYATLLNKFQEYCDPKSNVVFERHMFFEQYQESAQTIDSYVSELRNLASTCDFGDLNDGLILTQLIRGIKDQKLRLKLLNEDSDGAKKLTLDSAIKMCRTTEISRSQAKQYNANGSTSSEKTQNIAAVRNPGKNHSKSRSNASANWKSSTTRSENPVEECENCGSSHEYGRCPARGQMCNYCHRRGHFKNSCRKLQYANENKHKSKPSNSQSKWSRQRKSNSKKSVHALEFDEDDYDDCDDCVENLFVGSVSSQSSAWTVGVKVNEKPLMLKLDTGADCSVMSLEQYNKLSNEPLKPSSAVLVGYPNTKLKPVGEQCMRIDYQGSVYDVMFKIVNGESPTLLGRSDCVKMKLIQFNKPEINMISKSEFNDNVVSERLKSEFKDVFHGLGKLPYEYEIETDPSVPAKVCPPRSVPIAIKDRVQSELQKLEKEGVIKPVDEFTPWVSNMVAVVSPEKVRLCIDPTHLNRAIRRQQYPMHTIEEVVRQIPNARYFAKYDASQGFYQIPLTEESSKLCTFATPFGRYRFTRMPYGIKSAPEIFQRVMDQVICGLDKTFVIVDDVIQAASSLEELEMLSRKFLERCREVNLKLNVKKFAFGLDELSYVGHVLSSEGLKADPNKVKAVVEMADPSNKEELQRVLGVATYLAKFIPNMSQETAPMRQLLEKDVEFQWDKPQKDSFRRLKQLICDAPVLAYYDVKKECVVSVDSSSYGVGAVLLQEGKPIAYASKSLTKSQKNYPQIEKEMLAICFGCERFHQYIYGKAVVVESDHKPLEAIFKKQLNQIPARLQIMMMKLGKYDLSVRWKPGKELVIPDHLSRSPQKELLTDEFQVFLALAQSQDNLQEIASSTAKDPVLSQVTSLINHGWPSSAKEVSEDARVYFHIRDELTILNGIIFKGDRIVIPSSLRQQCLEELHYPHLGVNLTQCRARESIFWPGLSKDIENAVKSCSVCQAVSNNNAKEPLVSTPCPSKPWSHVATDLFEISGKHYLLLVDHYSGFVEIDLLSNLSAQEVILRCKSQFARHGIPELLHSDNGPQFSSQLFAQFAKTYKFTHNTSSPYNQHANGLAERAVGTVKNLIQKAIKDERDPYLALLAYRNTPRSSDIDSPAQRLYSRRLRTPLPMKESLLFPKISKPQKQIDKAREQQAKYYNRNAHNLKTLSVGDKVWYKTEGLSGKWLRAIVVECFAPRTYVVQKANGKRFRRARQHLKLDKTTEKRERKDSERLSPENNREQSRLVKFVPSANNPRANNPRIRNMPQRQANNNQVQRQQPVDRRTRAKTVPARFNDYVMT